MSLNPGLAKTSHPKLSGVLARERLFNLLDQRRRGSGIWIKAGAGCGKTTLVASYLNARGLDSCWYHLDSRDSDIATFFYYMSRAAGKSYSPALPLFTPEYHDELPSFARRFFQVLFEASSPSFVLVLDDYHEVSLQSPLHGVVESAIAETPPDVCVIVISRNEPPPSMARLRANRRLEVVGWEELRLTRQESDAIINKWDETCGELAREHLYEKTQGWAAGLVLMLDQIVTEGRVARVPDLSSRQLVFDYLAGEVLQGFDGPTRDLLLKTAFLNEMSPSMAAALASEPRAGEILGRLHREYHLVGLRQGNNEPVYRHHPLLADLLRARAEEELEEDERRKLRKRARSLLEAAGAYDDLVALLHSDEDWAVLTRVVLTQAPHMIHLGRAETLEQWLDTLPEERVAGDAWFHFWRATCCVHSAPREGRRLFERAFGLFRKNSPQDHDALLLTCSGAIDTIIFDLDDLEHLDYWIGSAVGLLDGDVPRSPEVEARATVRLFLSLVFRQPFHPALDNWSARARRALRAIENPGDLVSASLLLAVALNYTGQFEHARGLMAGMRNNYRSPHVPLLAMRALRYVESMYCMMTADREGCLEAVHDGLAIGRSTGVRRWTFHLLANGAAGALGVGDLDSGRELLSRMREHLDAAKPLELASFHYYSAWLHILAGDPATAFQSQKTALGFAMECGCPFYEVLCRVAIAQVLSELGDGEEAMSHLLRARSRHHHIHNRWLEFHELTAFAHVALRHGRSRQGLAWLCRALEVGRDNGFTHFLWWRPSMMSRLCARALDEGIEVDYVSRLVRERRLVPDREARHNRRWPWQFRIHAFGDFELLRDGKCLGVRTRLQRKPLELLKTLVGFGALHVPESRLAGSLWPRIAADYAYGSLTTALHRLRKLVGEDRLILMRHGHLSIDPDLCWIDLRAFEALTLAIDRGRRHGSTSDHESRVEAWTEELFTLYRGPFMGSEGQDPRYLLLRGRLRNQFLRSVGNLARYWEDRGEWERAADCYERGIEVDHLAEGLYRRLMLCYREADRITQAIDIYDRLRSTLEAEGSAEPARETTVIYRRMVDRL